MLKKYKNLNKQQKGFTLLEVLVAVSLIVVGLMAILSLMSQTLQAGSIDSNKIVAMNLAQEGIELVRNVRDSNWAAIPPRLWDKDLNGCGGGSCCIDYLDPKPDNGCNTSLKQTLYIDSSNGFYVHDDSGTNKKTIFERSIGLSPVGTGKKITSTVTWTERGTPHTFSLVSEIYDWK